MKTGLNLTSRVGYSGLFLPFYTTRFTVGR